MKTSCILLCGLLFSTSSFAFAADTQDSAVKNWTIDAHDNFVRYVTNGHTVHGHELGFIKQAGHCNDDILWISWSTYKKDLQAYEGTEATFQFRADKTSFPLQLPLLSAYNYKHLITLAAFTNFVVNERFIRLLKGHDSIEIGIVGPKDLANNFDIRQDSFSLIRFSQARAKAKAMCEKL